MLKSWHYLLSMQGNYLTVYHIQLGDCILLNVKHKSQIYLIIKGYVKVGKIFRNNYMLVFALLTNNDLIWTQNISTTCLYLVEALCSTSLISCSYGDILYHCKHLTMISYEIVSAYHRYIDKSNQIAQLLSHRDKKHRLINLLLILCKEKGIITKFGIVVNLFITHYNIASIIGSSRITVNKVFNTLKENRLISTWNNKIIIHDPISLSLASKLFFVKNLVI